MRRTLDIFGLNSLGCCELFRKLSYETDPRSGQTQSGHGPSNTNAQMFLRRPTADPMLDAVAKSSSSRVLAPSWQGAAAVTSGGPAHWREAQVLERRAHNRYLVNLGATASLGALILSQRCRVRDASVGGLGVWLGGTRFIPLEFDLTIEGNLLPVPCCLVWRGADFAGLRFARSAAPDKPSTWEEKPNVG
jgi:hypothetical protein